MEEGKFLIIEQGEYSDYSMYFIKVPENLDISESDILFLISLDTWDKPTIAGHIWGKIDVRVEDLEERAKKEINQMFACFDNRPNTTVVDREYSKDELIKIATENDYSGRKYWRKETDDRYDTYKKAIKLYFKLKGLKGGE